MKAGRKFRNAAVQFGYEHREMGGRIQKVKKSADELGKLLENMGKKGKKE